MVDMKALMRQQVPPGIGAIEYAALLIAEVRDERKAFNGNTLLEEIADADAEQNVVNFNLQMQSAVSR